MLSQDFEVFWKLIKKTGGYIGMTWGCLRKLEFTLKTKSMNDLLVGLIIYAANGGYQKSRVGIELL